MKRFLVILAIMIGLCVLFSVTAMAYQEPPSSDEPDTSEPVQTSIVIQVLSADGVTYEEHTVYAIPVQTVNATCTTAGYIRYQCLEDDCLAQNLYHDVVIPPVDHSYTKVVFDEGYYCVGGTYHLVCRMCGQSEGITYTIDPLTEQQFDNMNLDVSGETYHCWTDWNVETVATCCKEGLKTRVCVYCGAAQYETIEKLDHSFAISSYTVKDCTHLTVTWKCTVAGCNCSDNSFTETLTGDYHKWQLTDTVAATCLTGGTNTYTCSVCGETKTVEVAALGHLYSDYILMETYTLNGQEYGLYVSYCERCGLADKQTVMLVDEDGDGVWDDTHSGNAPGVPDANEPGDNEAGGASGEHSGEPEVVENVYAMAQGTIAISGNSVSGTGAVLLVEGNQDVGTLYARIAVVFENEDGEQLLVVAVNDVHADMTYEVSAQAPYGYTVKNVMIIAVTGNALGGDYAEYAVTDSLVL